MSDDKLVTHANLNTLRALRSDCSEFEKDEQRLLDRLIAAAEADKPPLPEGWVLARHDDGRSQVFWHEGGRVYVCDNHFGHLGSVDHLRSRSWRLTPLRPTVTEADVEKAAQALYVLQRGEWVSGKGVTHGGTPWGTSAEAAEHDRFLTFARAALTAAGIEVRDV